MTAVQDKLPCTLFVVFGKNEDRFGRIAWYQTQRNDNKYLSFQLKWFRRDDKAEFCKQQQIFSRESELKQPLHLHNPFVVATEELSREQN